MKDLLVRHRPVRGKGRPTKEQAENVTNGHIKTPHRTSNSRASIEQRLSRDFPQVWEKYLPGFLLLFWLKLSEGAALALAVGKNVHHGGQIGSYLRRSDRHVSIRLGESPPLAAVVVLDHKS